MDLAELALSTRLTPDVVSRRTREIYQRVPRPVAVHQVGNFRSIHADDLAQLFESYDTAFFRGACQVALRG